MPANNRKNPFLLAPALALAVLVLLLIFSFAVGSGGTKTYALILVFTLVAFCVPLACFFLLRGARLDAVLPLRPLKKREILLSVVCVLTLVWLMASVKYGLFGSAFDYREGRLLGFSFSYPESFGEGLLALVSCAVLPAILEELVFRGAVFYEYRMAGAPVSALLSALLSSLLRFSFSSFLSVFVCAFFFALIRFLTGNLAASMLAHAGYGVYVLFLEKYVWLMSRSDESRTLFMILCVLLLGVSLWGFLHLSEKLLRERASEGDAAPFLAPKNKRALVLFDILSAPPLWIALGVYLIVAIVRLFV